MRIAKFLWCSLFLVSTLLSFGQVKIQDAGINKKKFNFIVAADLGRNGRYDQKKIAELMGEIAGDYDAEFIVSAGDTHHYMGVQSVNDPLWMTNYELIYNHPELQIEWLPILGNHEYRGNTEAVIEYSQISRRWCMPSRYYSRTFQFKDGGSLLLVFVDTPPLIDKYRKESASYPDAYKQDKDLQLQWIDSVLSNSDAKWKIVVGHHPIYAETSKDISERTDLQERLDPILRKYNVNMYICGHIHNFQHIKPHTQDIDYVVNTSGSLSRKVNPIEGTKFCNPDTGFSLISADSQELELYMINAEGEVVYTIKK